MSAVSIIIPSYRQPHFLRRAIESCLEQEHEDLEVIVVDDASRDASLGVAASFAQRDARVRVIEASENGGLGRTRNVGLAHAQGDYICFLDADDYLLPSSLSARLAAWPAAQEIHGDSLVAVYGDWQHVGESVDYPTVRSARTDMAVVSQENYTGENVFICSAPLVRRSAVLEAGGFPEGLPMLEDFALWAKMIAAGGVFAPVAHVVATYRQRPNSMLRGDGVVVMGDYVETINSWMVDQGIALADGGALGAWLDGRPPHSFGRMSWVAPSSVGFFSDETDISETDEEPLERTNVESVPNFMHEPVDHGLHDPDPILSMAPPIGSELAVIVESLESAVTASGLAQGLDDESDSSVAVYCDDPQDWSNLWPLALSHLWARPLSDLPSESEPVDLSQGGNGHGHRLVVASTVVDRLAPVRSETGAAVVYVSGDLAGYPALDAWISVASRAAMSEGLDVELLADPSMASELRGWRFTFMALDTIAGAPVVIAPAGDSARFIAEFAPTIEFAPGSDDSDAVRTATELRAAIDDQLG